MDGLHRRLSLWTSVSATNRIPPFNQRVKVIQTIYALSQAEGRPRRRVNPGGKNGGLSVGLMAPVYSADVISGNGFINIKNIQ